MRDSEFVFADRSEPVDAELRCEGALPPAFKGTFYAIGGAGCRVGQTPLHPLLDAHGRVVAIRIENGKASLRARVVETPLWRDEQASKRITKRRLFTNKPSRWSNLFDVDLANPAGHNVVPWGEHLVATNDPGFFLLDPVTLQTRGPSPIRPAKGASFSPMPRRDPSTGRRVLFEVRPGLRDTLVVRELDDGFGVASEHSYKLSRGAAFFHDVAFTERFYLVMQWSSLSLPTVLWGAAPVFEALRFDPAKTPMLHLLPRQGGQAISIPLPGGRSHFHFWNAHEAGGRVVADAIGYAGMPTFRSLIPPEVSPARPPPTPSSATWRYTIDPEKRSVHEEQLSAVAAEAPAIREDRRGRPYRFGWAPAPGGAGDEEDRGGYFWYHALCRHDFEQRSQQLWDAGPRAFVSAAAFVPREGGADEDDGHVLALIQDVAANAVALAIFDARDVAAGPIARLSGPGLVGVVSHVAFA